MSMTYCYGASNWDYTFTNDKGYSETYHGFPPPSSLDDYIEAGPDTWASQPGVHAKFTFVGACDIKHNDADIWVFGIHGKENHIGGAAVCWKAGKGDWCKRDVVWITDDHEMTTARGHAYMVSAAVHEFGHVLGLSHPCQSTCYGPIMSYYSCAHSPDGSCVTAPSYADIVGVQLIYGWHDTPGGGCDVVVSPSTQDPGARVVKPPVLPTSNLLDLIPGTTAAGVLQTLPYLDDGDDVVGAARGVVNEAASRVTDYHVNPADEADSAVGAVQNEVGSFGVNPPDLYRVAKKCVAGS